MTCGRAPKITSRRQGGKSFITTAYWSDAETKQMDELGTNIKSVLKVQDEMKSRIEQMETDAGKNQKVVDDMAVKLKDFSSKTNQYAQLKSFGDLLSEGIQESVEKLQKFARKELKSFDFQFKTVGDMTFGTNFATADTTTANVMQGIVSNPDRKVHVRDLLFGGGMTGSTFHYMKEYGDGEGAIAPVAEGNTKSQIDIDLKEEGASAEYIAGWLRLSTKMLDDIPALTSFLSTRLLQKLLKAEDYQLLQGNGNSPNLKGLFHTDNHTAFSGSSTIAIEKILQAISQVEELDREATGIVLRNSDYWDLVINKANGSGEYDLPKVVTIGEDGILRIAGVPVSRTTAMLQDSFLVGDFLAGAMLLFREPPRVEFFYEDGNNVRENKVTVRVEERVAFPVFGDNYFVYGEFGSDES
jgi:HK97 family phage major capsid protein